MVGIIISGILLILILIVVFGVESVPPEKIYDDHPTEWMESDKHTTLVVWLCLLLFATIVSSLLNW